MSKHLIFDESKLRTVCERVTQEESNDTFSTTFILHTKLKKYPYLCGIAAPQIGVNKRIISLNFNDGTTKDFFNPHIKEATKGKLFREQYTYVDKDTKNKIVKDYIILRASELNIEFINEKGESENIALSGGSAEIFQRCNDYLNGILVPDKGLEILDGFDEAPSEVQQEIIQMYIDSLKRREQAINDIINEDETLTQITKQRELLNDMKTGNVELLSQREAEEYEKSLKKKKRKSNANNN